MRGATVALLVAAVIAVSARWGSFVAGGSDSYCYVSQAQRWAGAMRGVLSGRSPGESLHVVEPLALEAPWPDAPLTFTPVGHVPSPRVAGAVAPVCPSGLSIAMAPFVLAAGPAAAFAVVPLFGALLIVATYTVGARFGAHVGMAAALVTAASPVFLYQLVQPMSDVPAASLWVLAVAFATGTSRRHAWWSGVATGGAILMRPNLVPLGFLVGLFLLFRPERSWRQRFRAAISYAGASAAGCLAVALVQGVFFGSPFSSGYGSLDDLFAAAHVAPNLGRYAAWTWQVHTPAILLAVAAPLLLPGALTTLLLGMFAVNLALYLPYTVFEDWSFLRFLLPTLPLLLVLVVAVFDAICRRLLRVRNSAPWVVAAALALSAVFVRTAIERQTFELQRMEARFERAGRFVATLPENAIVITSWHSGSVRFYGGKTTLEWAALDPAWLNGALDFLQARGYEPYFLFDRGEESAFRQRFSGTAIGALDWPPMVEVAGQVRIFRPGDRQRYLRGNAPPTQYVR